MNMPSFFRDYLQSLNRKQAEAVQEWADESPDTAGEISEAIAAKDEQKETSGKTASKHRTKS